MQDIQKNPWGDFLEKLTQKYQYAFFYGESDWMDVMHDTQRISKLPITSRVEGLVIVDNCGHNMIAEDVPKLLEEMMTIYDKFKTKNDELVELISPTKSTKSTNSQLTEGPNPFGKMCVIHEKDIIEFGRIKEE